MNEQNVEQNESELNFTNAGSLQNNEHKNVNAIPLRRLNRISEKRYLGSLKDCHRSLKLEREECNILTCYVNVMYVLYICM